MTSNLGSQFLLDGIQNGEITADARENVMKLLRSQFRPEFLNRIDEIVFYKPLEKAEIRQIVCLLAKSLESLPAEREITLTLTDAAIDKIADAGFDPVYGARPLKRYMQSHLETMLAKAIIGRGRSARPERHGGCERKRRAGSEEIRRSYSENCKGCL